MRQKSWEASTGVLGRAVVGLMACAQAGVQTGAPIGMLIGAVLGTIVPLLGNLIGAIVGFLLGGVVGASCAICIGALEGKRRGAYGGLCGIVACHLAAAAVLWAAGEPIRSLGIMFPLVVLGAIGALVGDDAVKKFNDPAYQKKPALVHLRRRLFELDFDAIPRRLRAVVALAMLYIPSALLVELVRALLPLIGAIHLPQPAI